MTLEERITAVREHYPDPMTQSELAKAIGVGKSTVYKLLRDGIIPYSDSHERGYLCHIIRRDDVIRYLTVKYAHAAESYIDAGQHCITMMIWDEPEVLTVKDVMRITGLWKSAIQKWINTGKVKAFSYRNGTVIRKSDLIAFMALPEYQDSSHRGIRAEAITKAVEWYSDVRERFQRGGIPHDD